jgi:hypothetical protein
MAKRTAKKRTAWTDLVKQIYHKNKKLRGGYSLKDAMTDAKKVYNKSAKGVSSLVNKTRRRIPRKNYKSSKS